MNLVTIADDKIFTREQSTLAVYIFLLYDLCVRTPSLRSSGPTSSWNCNFHKMHPVIIDDN